MPKSDAVQVTRLLQELAKLPTDNEVYASGRGSGTGAKVSIELQRRLNKFTPALVRAAKSAILEAGEEILLKAVNRAPVETGALVESGRLYLGKKPIAKGKVASIDYENKIAETYIETINDQIKNKFNVSAEDSMDIKKGRFNVYISFFKSVPGLENLALWLHNNLEVHGEGSPGARFPGRGGRYLDEPLNEVMGDLLGMVEDNIEQVIRVYKEK